MIFDQYQRYKTIQVIVKYIKDLYHLERVSILELGANEECNLEKVLPSENIQYSDIKLSDQMKQSGKFVEADGTNLYQFEDQSYDIVIALDVLEHVPDNARESFLFEAHRVSKYMAIMCFPYDSLYNSSAEKCANNYYKAIYGCDHIWLKEHIENGLPKLDAIRHLMNKTEINYTLVHHGSTMLWEEMIKALFASYHSNKYFDLMESLDEFYAEYIYRHDMVQKSYRVFLMMGRDNKEIKKIEEYLNHYFDGDIAQEDLQHLYLNIEDLKRLGERKEEKVEESNHKVKIYYDYGRGYNEADTRMVEAKAITNDKYRVSLLEYNVQDLYNIRIDPVEGSNCMITRCAIKQGDEQVSLGYSMHIEGNSGVILLGDDPILMTSIKNQEMPISIELEFIVEGKEFTEEVLRNYATQIEDTKDKDKAIYEWNEKCNASQERIVILEQEQKKKEEYIIKL